MGLKYRSIWFAEWGFKVKIRPIMGLKFGYIVDGFVHVVKIRPIMGLKYETVTVDGVLTG